MLSITLTKTVPSIPAVPGEERKKEEVLVAIGDLKVNFSVVSIFLAILMLPVIIATTIHACLWIMGYQRDKVLKINSPLLKRVLSLSAYETAKKVCFCSDPKP